MSRSKTTVSDATDVLAEGTPLLDEPQQIEERIALGGRTLREHTARGAIINAAFQIGMSALSLGKRIAVAAFLTTSQFGFWGILVTTLLTLGWLKQIGISDKFVQQDEADQELAFQKAFTLELAYTLLFYGLVLVALPIYAIVYDTTEILLPGFILSLSFLGSALQTPIWIAYRQMRFFRQRSLESLDPVVSAIVTVGLAAAGASYWSLVIGALAGTLAAGAGALITCPYKIRWRFDRGTLREYFGFSWPLFVSGLAGIVTVQGATIIGNYTVGLAGLGAFALATTFAVFADRVDHVIRQTIYPAVCAVADRRELLFEVFEKSNRLALMWGMTFGVGLALFAPDLITFVLGERWRGAEFLLQAFGLIIGFRQVAFNWTVFLRAMNMTKPIALNGFVLMICFAAITAPLMFEMGLDGYALGMAIALVVDLAIRGFYLQRLFAGFRLAPHIIRAIAPSVPAILAVLAVRAPDIERTLAVAIGELFLYLLVTALATWLLERPLMRELGGYLRRATAAAPAPTG
jgi:PST family polysaccharide transporter